MTQKLRIGTITPTVFYVRDGDRLKQQVLLTLDNDGAYNIKVRFYPLSQQQWWPLQETN